MSPNIEDERRLDRLDSEDQVYPEKSGSRLMRSFRRKLRGLGPAALAILTATGAVGADQIINEARPVHAQANVGAYEGPESVAGDNLSDGIGDRQEGLAPQEKAASLYWAVTLRDTRISDTNGSFYPLAAGVQVLVMGNPTDESMILMDVSNPGSARGEVPSKDLQIQGQAKVIDGEIQWPEQPIETPKPVEVAAARQYAVVNTSSATINVRKEANGEVISSLNNGQAFIAGEEEDGWVQAFDLEQNFLGYVSGDLIRNQKASDLNLPEIEPVATPYITKVEAGPGTPEPGQPIMVDPSEEKAPVPPGDEGEVLNASLDIPEEVKSRAYDNLLDGYVKVENGKELVSRELIGGDTVVTDTLNTEQFGQVSLEVPADWKGLPAENDSFSFLRTEEANTEADITKGLETFWLMAYQKQYGVDEATARQFLDEDRPVTINWNTTASRPVEENMVSYEVRPSQGVSIVMFPNSYEIRGSVGPTDGPYERITSLYWWGDASKAISAYPVGYSGTEHGRLTVVTQTSSVGMDPKNVDMASSGNMALRFSDLILLVGDPDWSTFLDDQRRTQGLLPGDTPILNAFGFGSVVNGEITTVDDPRITDELPLVTSS